MNTYADYLNTMTVKALNIVARDMGLARYGKLRKAALITLIDDSITALIPTVAPVAEFTAEVETVSTPMGSKVLDSVGNVGHVSYAFPHDDVINVTVAGACYRVSEERALRMMEAYRKSVAPKAVIDVAFSAKPASIKRVPVAPVKVETVTNPYADVETDDLVEAYQGMRRTLHKSRGDVHMRLATRLRALSRELKSRKVAMREI